MRRSTSRLLIGLFAAPLMLASSAALADPCGGFEALASGKCEFKTSGGCTTECTPLNFVAACDGQCTANPMVDCTGTCGASCEADCMVDPGKFDCAGSCSSSCKESCGSSCSDSGCIAQCEASCDNRCAIKCEAVPPSADCTAKCSARCDASCTVQANVDCSAMCSVDLEGGCKTQCSEPQGALFCGGQYVHATDIDACIAYLATQGFDVSVDGHCDVSGCEVTTGLGGTGVGCSATPYVGAVSERWGVGAIAGLMMGVGMFVSRRRRRA